MEGFVRQSLLYDFYGDLLTDHQKEIYESYVQDNLSLGEIADIAGISRQGVHDTIKRCNALLEGYEEKLKLVDRFLKIKALVKELYGCAEMDSVHKIADRILEYIQD